MLQVSQSVPGPPEGVCPPVLQPPAGRPRHQGRGAAQYQEVARDQTGHQVDSVNKPSNQLKPNSAQLNLEFK